MLLLDFLHLLLLSDENNPRNEYPDEISDVEVEEEEEVEEDGVESEDSDKSENESERGDIYSRDAEWFLDDDFCYGDFEDDNIHCVDDDDDENGGNTEDWSRGQ